MSPVRIRDADPVRDAAACAGITLPNEASVGLHESLGFLTVGINRRIG